MLSTLVLRRPMPYNSLIYYMGYTSGSQPIAMFNVIYETVQKQLAANPSLGLTLQPR